MEQAPGGSSLRWDDLPEHDERPCGYCGYEPDRIWAEREERRRRVNRKVLQEEVPDALAPARGHPDTEPGPTANPSGGAMILWPEFLEDLPAEHPEYSHRIEARIKRIVRTGPGHRMYVSPITVDGLAAFCTQHGDDPETAEARSSYGAEISRRGEAVPWPAGHNPPCWCGSRRKYQTCCGPIPPASA